MAKQINTLTDSDMTILKMVANHENVRPHHVHADELVKRGYLRVNAQCVWVLTAKGKKVMAG